MSEMIKQQYKKTPQRINDTYKTPINKCEYDMAVPLSKETVYLIVSRGIKR